MKSFDQGPPDISAEERYYSRSLKIRRSVLTWLDSNIGRGWVDLMTMAGECGNSGKPMPFSSITAYRWIAQFTAPGFAFGIDSKKLDEEGLYRLVRTRPLTGKDFKRWGIPVPKRFKK
jgi:hypothetical protein